MLENVFTLCFMLGQTWFSALDSQTMLILPHAADLPTSSPKELKRKGEEFPLKARHSGQYYTASPHPLVPVHVPFSVSMKPGQFSPGRAMAKLVPDTKSVFL